VKQDRANLKTTRPLQKKTRVYLLYTWFQSIPQHTCTWTCCCHCYTRLRSYMGY